MKNTLILLVIISFFWFSGCSKDKEAKKSDSALSGMSATFPLPFYGIVFENYYKQTGIRINESGQGSSAGIRALQDKTVDFIGSDAIPTKRELAEIKEEIIIIPACLGGLVITINLPGIQEINLDGPIIADIFMNKIKYWNNEAIQKINPGKNLPNKKIILVYRSDGSGSSYVLSDYLSKVSPEWNHKMGRGKSLDWRGGIAVKNSMQVASVVSELVGAIGYTSAEHADIFNLSSASIKNMEGEFIKYNTQSILAAADEQISDYPLMITNSSNKNAYPLSCYSWILVYKNQAYDKRSIEKYNSLKHFLEFLISDDTQNIAGKLNYVALPEHTLQKAKELISKMEWKRVN